MRLNNPLDSVFDNGIKIRILRIFCQTNIELNGRQIAREVKVTPKTSHRILLELVNEGVLFMKNVGRTYLFELNKENLLVKGVLKVVFSLEKKAANKIFEVLLEEVKRSDLKDEIVSLALFGSIHEKNDRPGSDVDILVVIKDSGSQGKIERFFETIERKTLPLIGNTISVYLNTIACFRTKAKNKLPIIVNILKSHRLIYGQPLKDILNVKEI